MADFFIQSVPSLFILHYAFYIIFATTMLQEILQDYGLTAKESNVYLVCLELGTAPVSSIARRLGENRVTTYSNLKNLVKRGIVIEVPKKSSTYYSVITPEKLIQDMEDKYVALKDALPEFMALANVYNNKPKVQFFEGIDGLKQVYDDLLSSETKQISSFLGVGSVSKRLAEYLNLHFLPKRVKMGIHAKVLMCHNDEKSKYHVYTSGKTKQLLTEYRLLDFDFVNLYNEINIYGDNKIAFVMYGDEEMSALIIHNKKLHDSLQSIFDLTWLVAAQT
jgi:sugar-specific transcriptional regulator TrmB